MSNALAASAAPPIASAPSPPSRPARPAASPALVTPRAARALQEKKREKDKENALTSPRKKKLSLSSPEPPALQRLTISGPPLAPLESPSRPVAAAPVNPRNQYLTANPMKSGETLSKTVVTLHHGSDHRSFEVRYDLLPLELLSPRILKARGPARHIEIVELKPMDGSERIRPEFDPLLEENVFRADSFQHGVAYELVTKDPRKALAKLLSDQEKATFKEEFNRFDRDGDGLIAFDEIAAAYDEMVQATAQQVAKQFAHLPAEKLDRKLRAVSVKASASVLMMKKQDLDGDGALNWKEFLYAQAYRMKILGLLKGRQRRPKGDGEQPGEEEELRSRKKKKKKDREKERGEAGGSQKKKKKHKEKEKSGENLKSPKSGKS